MTKVTAKKKTKLAVVATKTQASKSQPSGLGLGDMGDLSALLNDPGAAWSGLPADLDLGLIDEDHNQPRAEDNPGFTEESLGELAKSIKLRGVKTPISVRDNPEFPGRKIINHGARRFRASKLAGKTTIPGFTDNDYNEADQVVENLQRNDLTPREIADFIGRELAKGFKKGQIAESISKSAAFVSQHVTLLDLPEAIARAFNSGRVSDVTAINELVTAIKKNEREVMDWLDDASQEITRESVKLLREFLEVKGDSAQTKDKGAGGEDDRGEGLEAPKKSAPKDADPEKIKKAIIQVLHDDRPARLLLSRRPPAEGFAWLKYDDDGLEFEAQLAVVKLVAVVEG